MEKYTDAIIKNIILYQQQGEMFSTVYFGGGTPSLLGSKRLAKIIAAINKTDDAEVTVECNPFNIATAWSDDDIKRLAHSGANRISMGMQSAVDAERKVLGRKADRAIVEKAVKMVRQNGFDNFSLDLMLGIPHQTVQSVKESVKFCIESGAKHISSYLLKIEQGTPFQKVEGLLDLPDEDYCCELYLTACEAIEGYGCKQYEISNFAYSGFESRHNLIYWDCREYLGIGAAAHSFYKGKRFYYERSASDFINGAVPLPDGEGGSFEEYVMLRLRLSEGLVNEQVKRRFGFEIPQSILGVAKELEPHGLTVCDEKGVRLTPKGFLLSNTIIGKMI